MKKKEKEDYIIPQYCELLFSLKERRKPEYLLLETGMGEEIYRIKSAKKKPQIRMFKKNFTVYDIDVLLQSTETTKIKVAYNSEIDRTYLLAC